MITAQSTPQTVSTYHQSQIIETVIPSMAESDNVSSTNTNDTVLSEIIKEFGDIAVRDYPSAVFSRIRNSKVSSWFKKAVMYRTKSSIPLSKIYN